MSYLRVFQSNVETQVLQAWQEGLRVVMAVMPTGSGKTRTCGKIMGDSTEPCVAISHRQELVGQWSASLAEYGVRHAVIAPDAVVREIVRDHMENYGRSFVDQNSHHCVSGVRSWLKLGRNHTRVVRTKKGTIDEAHHVQVGNEFGAAIELTPQARFVLPTATPMRADGGGMGAGQGGYAERLILGPNARELTMMGYLTDWDIVCPEESVDVSNVPISSTTHDFSMPKLRDAIHQSRSFVGDVVQAYLDYAPGKLGMVFAVDVESASKIAEAFRARGVTAECVHGKTPGELRRLFMRKFRLRELLVLVNVDLFGEGTDVPALEVVLMARHTDSFGLYDQQSGRVKRLMIAKYLRDAWDNFTNEQRREHIAQSVKPFGLIIDLVGNFGRHGPSDAPRPYTLNRREGRGSSKSDAVPTRRCTNKNRGDGIACAKMYPRVRLKCPFCGSPPELLERRLPSQVDGDIALLDRDVVEALRQGITHAQQETITPPWHLPQIAQMGIRNRHHEALEARKRLRDAMAWWGGRAELEGYNEREQQRYFYLTFGTDVLTAQTLSAKDADTLAARVLAKIRIDGFVIPA